MNWSSSVLTTASTDTEPSIIVTFSDAKYIFNTSENTMRSFLQTGRHWRKAKALFFTQARVEKTSGLPGLVMTFADATISNLKLHGPQGLNHILASMRLFTSRDSIKIQTSEISWSAPPTPTPCYSDNNIKIYAIPLSVASEANEPIPTNNQAANLGKRKREASPERPSKRTSKASQLQEGSLISNDLLSKFKEPDFRPEILEGALAGEYREVVIRTMFPGTNINLPIAGNQGKKVAERDDHKKTKSPPPPGFRLQLPPPSFKPPSDKETPTLSYLLVGPQYRGKFNAERAKELGVPNGPLRSKLARGETISFEVKENGILVKRTVKPEEVVAKPEPPAGLLILDIPSPEYIPSLVSSFKNAEFYRKFWSENPSVLETKDPEYNLRLVYHLLGERVLEDARYKEFLKGFASITHHIVSSKEHSPDPITFTNAAFNQLRLNHLDEKVFHIPKYSLTPKKELSSVEGLPPNTHLMISSLDTTLRPWVPPVSDPEVLARDKFHPVILGNETLVYSSDLEGAIKIAKEDVATVLRDQTESQTLSLLGADVGVIPLGTGGSLPSKYRNVLSTLIRIPGYGNILLDAGEGTWGQLARNFGVEDSEYNAWQALRDLKCIFISHMHADHHVGLAHILAKRQQLDPPPSEPLYIVSVRGIHLYLRELSGIQDLGLSNTENGVIPVLSESLHFNSDGTYPTQGMWSIGGKEAWLDYDTSVKNAQKMCEALGLEFFKTIDMFHRCRCYGSFFKHKDGWSIAFSGDTAPSENLRKVAANTTVLIHEATMADSERETARQKAHSTIGQAIHEGKKMGAKNIFLTHFSARYPKMPHYLTTEEANPWSYEKKNMIVPAFDHANFTIGDMWKMQFYLSSIHKNFLDTLDLEEIEQENMAASVSNVARG